MKQDKYLLEKGAKIYLLGICGTGMAALAGLLKEKGFRVTGADSGCYPPMDGVLKKLGIKVHEGYEPKDLERENPDLTIIGNVITKDNPCARFVLERQIPYMSFPQAMGEFFLSERKPIVVTGTHGKTTTSTLVLSALEACGQDPGFMIGGVPMDRKSGFGLGSGKWFVVEGDEYDSSFFQKVSKFLFYRPFGAIITSMEFDHADIFNSLDEIKESFKEFARLVPDDGVLVACKDWDSVMEAASFATCHVVTYGIRQDAHWRLMDLEIHSESTSFIALGPKGQKIRVRTRLPGQHNALNCLSVIALLDHFGMDMEKVAKGIGACKGVKRRQEVRGIVNNIVVIDDFAHHPHAVKETLRALKKKYGDRRLVAVFEPRTNTSRRSVFQKDYPLSFTAADKIFVRDVPQPEKAPEGDRFSSRMLVHDLKAMGKEAHFCANASEIIEKILKDLTPGDVYVILSNGPFEGIHQRLLDSIRSAMS